MLFGVPLDLTSCEQHTRVVRVYAQYQILAAGAKFDACPLAMFGPM